jgi:peptidoglycan/LPS O-acetylase OafA/YrhL
VASARQAVDRHPGRRGSLDRLTSLRALAALAVFAFHVGQYNVWYPAKLAGFGYAGVAFFFTLSGFVLVWSARPDDNAGRFFQRRFARIYPSYLAVLLVACVVPHVAVYRGADAGILSVTLTQAWVPLDKFALGLNGVSWSLSCEAAFYAVFPLLLAWMVGLGRRRLVGSMLGAYVIGAVVVVAATVYGPGGATLALVNPLIRLPEFMLGMAAGLAFAEGWRPRIDVRLPVAILVLLYLAGGLLHLPKPMMDPVLAPVFVAIVVASAASDAAGTRSLLTSRALVYAGEVSFCFYLVHELVIINVAPYLSGPAAVAVDFVAAAILAAVVHHLVELPCQRWLRPGGGLEERARMIRSTRPQLAHAGNSGEARG